MIVIRIILVDIGVASLVLLFIMFIGIVIASITDLMIDIIMDSIRSFKNRKG